MKRLVFLRDIVLLFLYTLTTILALIGNVLVFRISSQRRTKLFPSSKSSFSLNTPRLFLLNLALADTLLALTIPLQFIFCSKYFLENVTLSSYICALNTSVQILGSNASILTICLIAFDRYRLIQNPLQQYDRKKLFQIISSTWILSGLFSASYLISTHAHTYFNSYDRLISCQILNPSIIKYLSNDYIRKLRILLFIILFYTIPLLITIILCVLTIRIITRRTIIGIQQFRTFEQSRTRSIGLLVTTIIVFVVSHSPIHFIHLRDFIISLSKVTPMRSTRTYKCNDSTMYLFFYWLSICSCCHNPIIHSWFNRRFRTLVGSYCRTIVYCRR